MAWIDEAQTSSTRITTWTCKSYIGTSTEIAVVGFIVIGAGPHNITFSGYGANSFAGGLTTPVVTLYNETNTQVGAVTGDGASFTYQVTGTGAGKPYTAKLTGYNNTTGIGRLQMATTELTSVAFLGQVSARATIGTGLEQLSTSFTITSTVSAKKRIAVLGVGPNCKDTDGSPIANTIPNPLIELYNNIGTLIDSNDSYTTNRVILSGSPLYNSAIDWSVGLSATEAVMLNDLTPNTYFCTMRPNGTISPGTTAINGVGLLEVFMYNIP